MKENEFPSLYITQGITLRKKTKEDWEKERRISNIKYNQERTLEEYKKFTKNWDKEHSDYIISSYNHAYFMNKDTAIESVIGNMGGMDEAGVVCYAAIIKVPTGVSYCEFSNVEEIYFYEYDSNTSQYKPLEDTNLRTVLISYFNIKYLDNRYIH